MAHVAFLGTGLLGSGMVERMLARGHHVSVWNRTESKARALEKAGAILAATPADAVRSASRVHMALPDDGIVEELLGRFAPNLERDAVVIDHSTTLPAATRERLPRWSARGVRLLHAPVFMSPQMCRDGEGIMLVSGLRADFDEVRDALDEMTADVWYLGERPELAAAYKLFGNSMLFVLAGGVSDVLAMAKATGVDPEEAVGLFRRFKVGNMLAARGAKMAAGDFAATFELTMARKDLGLMLETAREEPLAVLPGIASRMDAAIAAGHGHEDLGVIAADLIRPGSAR